MKVEVHVSETFEVDVPMSDLIDELERISTPESQSELCRALSACIGFVQKLPDSVLDILTTGQLEIVAAALVKQAERYALAVRCS